MKRLRSIPSNIRPAARRAVAAFSLIEVLIAVTLMSIIVLGLMAMFGQTQRAFRTGMTQVDIMEGGRAALEMMAREMEQTKPTVLPNSVNFYAGWNGNAVIQTLPGQVGGNAQYRTNIVQDIFFTVQENRNWQGIYYRVLGTNAVGTLYRFETNTTVLNPLAVSRLMLDTPLAPPNRVVDGVVHLRVLAYDNLGVLIHPYRSYSSNLLGKLFISNNVPGELSYEYYFTSNAVPAYVELEIGLLEQKTLARMRNLATPAAQANYLKDKAGAVQVFRQRIPVRNLDPTVYQ